MPDLRRVDEVIYSKRVLINKMTWGVIIIYAMNLVASMIARIHTGVLMDGAVEACQASPEAEESFKIGSAQAINDYETSGNYQTDYDDKILVDMLIGIALSLVCGLFITIHLSVSQCNSHKAFSKYQNLALWVMYHCNVILPMFDQSRYSEISTREGYISGFALSCFRDDTKPGCDDIKVVNTLKRGIERAEAFAASCTYIPTRSLPYINFYHSTVAIFCFTLLAGLILGAMHPSIYKKDVSQAENTRQRIQRNKAIINAFLLTRVSSLLKSELALYRKYQARMNLTDYPKFYCPITFSLMKKPVKLFYFYQGRYIERHYEKGAISTWLGGRLHSYNGVRDPYNMVNLLEVGDLNISYDPELKTGIIRALRQKQASARAMAFYDTRPSQIESPANESNHEFV